MIVTSLGEARNNVIVRSADAVIVIGDSPGTLPELTLAWQNGVPVVSLGGWQIRDTAGNPIPGAPPAAATPHEAAATCALTSAASA